MKASVYTYTPCVFCCKTCWGSGAAFLGCPVLYEGQMYEDRWPVRAPSSPGSAVTGCEPAVAMGDTMSLLCRCGKQLWDTTCQWRWRLRETTGTQTLISWWVSGVTTVILVVQRVPGPGHLLLSWAGAQGSALHAAPLAGQDQLSSISPLQVLSGHLSKPLLTLGSVSRTSYIIAHPMSDHK